jgi:hypothetical protein
MRLSGRQNEKLRFMLPLEDTESKIVIGSCGSTNISTEPGIDLVITLHAIADMLMHDKADDKDKAIAWMAQQQKYYPLLPIVVRRDNRLADNTRSLVMDQLMRVGHGQGLLVQVREGGELAGFFLQEGSTRKIDSILVAGPDILLWSQRDDSGSAASELSRRFEQSFGEKTQRLVAGLKVGVVGTSGTGSPVAEMLYRLGAGEIVLVDDDHIQEKNLGRIYNSSLRDAQEKRLKVDVLGDAFSRCGLPSKVMRIAARTNDANTVRQLAQCDVIFGCMDTHSGRNLLNKLCTFYSIPYFDLGVNLEADKQGGVKVVCGAVHYLQPDGSSLISRKAINLEVAAAEDLKRANPERYDQLRKEKYIKGVNEEKPAVITVNTLIASLAMNDFLARLHPYRNNPNADIGSISIDLLEPRMVPEVDGPPDEGSARSIGLGDIRPLLGMPSFG